jgi:hypothetical protein
MKMPTWLRIKVSVRVAIKVSIALRLSPHVIGVTVLIGSYVLPRFQGHLPVLWAAQAIPGRCISQT